MLSRFYGARTTVSLTAKLKLVGETSFVFADGENAARAPKKSENIASLLSRAGGAVAVAIARLAGRAFAPTKNKIAPDS